MDRIPQHICFGIGRRGMYLTQDQVNKLGGAEALQKLFRGVHGSDPIQLMDFAEQGCLLETGPRKELEHTFEERLRELLSQKA